MQKIKTMNEPTVKQTLEPLYNSRKWINVVSIILILQGVFLILNIWGVIVCWIPIWMAVLLRSSANQLTTAYESNDPAGMRTALGKLGQCFRLFSILFLVMISVAVIGIVVLLIMTMFSDLFLMDFLREILQ